MRIYTGVRVCMSHEPAFGRKQHTALRCHKLQYTAMNYNTLQCTAIHCNTLQLTATHCNNSNMNSTTRTHSYKYSAHTYSYYTVKGKEGRNLLCFSETKKREYTYIHICIVYGGEDA